MKINPVLRNESKLAVRTWKFPFMVLIYTGLLATGGLLLYRGLTSDAIFSGLSLATPIRIYIVLAMVQAILLMFIVPSMSSTVISSEREKQTLEVLLSTKMSSLSIVIGKLISSVSKVILLILLSLPVYGITFLIGGVNLKNIFELSLFLTVTTFFVASIGIFFSTIFKSSKAATAATYGTVLLLIIGIVVGGMVVYIAKTNVAKDTVVNFPFFSIISPLTGLISLLFSQLGMANLLDGPLAIISPIMSMKDFGNMVYISMAIQAIATTLLVFISAYLLNPLRKKKYKMKKRNTKSRK